MVTVEHVSDEWDQINDHFRRPATDNSGQPQPGDTVPDTAAATGDFHAAAPPPAYDVPHPEAPRHAAAPYPQQPPPPPVDPHPPAGQWPPAAPPAPAPSAGPGWHGAIANQQFDAAPGTHPATHGWPSPQGPPPQQPPAPAPGFQGYGYQGAPAPGAAHWQTPPGVGEQANRRMDTNKLVDALSHKARNDAPKAVPSRGWRRAIHRSSFGAVNPGLSQHEKDLAERRNTIGQNLRGECYKIAVLVGKGGTGNSTLTTAVGSIFAEMRPNDRVIAMDADPSFGKLAERIAPDVAGTYWELLAEQQRGTLNRWTDVAEHLGSNSNTGLWLLRGEHRTTGRRLIDAEVFSATMDIINRYMQIALIDCGKFLEHPVMTPVLKDADAAIIVGALEPGAFLAAGQTLNWMEGQGHHRLLENTVVVLNDPRGRASKKARTVMYRDFDTHTDVPVVLMPYDSHLSAGGIIDTKKALSADARWASIEIANIIAERGFGGRGLTGPAREQGAR